MEVECKMEVRFEWDRTYPARMLVEP